MRPGIERRQLLGLGVAGGLLALAGADPAAAQSSAVLGFRLVEGAGLRRSSEPVSTRLPIPDAAGPYRLLRDGRPIPAQFRSEDASDGRGIWLDFAADLGPLESARFEVHHGRPVGPGPEPAEGLTLAATGSDLATARNGEPAFRFDRSLRGWIASVGSGESPWLAAGSPGLVVRLRDGTEVRPGSGPEAAASVARHGPAAVALRFRWTVAPGVEARAILTTPRSRPRVDLDWEVDDPSNRVESLGAELNLIFADGPPSVEAGSEGDSGRWLRARDARREVIAAVPGAGPDDLVELAGGSLLAIRRLFADDRSPRLLAVRIEFLKGSAPPDRRSSPLSLLHPIEVEWDRPAVPRG